MWKETEPVMIDNTTHTLISRIDGRYAVLSPERTGEGSITDIVLPTVPILAELMKRWTAPYMNVARHAHVTERLRRLPACKA